MGDGMPEYKIIRNSPEYYRATELMTRDAFHGGFAPTCDEQFLVHLLHAAPDYIGELDFIALTDGGEVIGNVIYSNARIVAADNTEYAVLTFGPLSVTPEYKRHGVGAALMRHSLIAAHDLGYRGVVFYGHPDYYPRFGFVPAGVFGITAPDGAVFDSLMAMELYPGAFDGISGRYFDSDLFDMDENEVTEFEKTLPPKEPASMVPLDALLTRLPEEVKKSFAFPHAKYLSYLNRLSGREILALPGVDDGVFRIVNEVLEENGLPKKLYPGCPILCRAKLGFAALMS